jgi:hypothetical protein
MPTSHIHLNAKQIHSGFVAGSPRDGTATMLFQPQGASQAFTKDSRLPNGGAKLRGGFA